MFPYKGPKIPEAGNWVEKFSSNHHFQYTGRYSGALLYTPLTHGVATLGVSSQMRWWTFY